MILFGIFLSFDPLKKMDFPEKPFVVHMNSLSLTEIVYFRSRLITLECVSVLKTLSSKKGVLSISVNK